MNYLRLKQIAENTTLASENEVTELKNLIAEFPYFALPYTILCKLYFKKEHYKFDDILHHTAIRVKDREWLYHYIRQQDNAEKTEIIVEQNTNIQIEIISEKDEIETVESNSIAEFLADTELETESVAIETIEEPLDLSEEELIEETIAPIAIETKNEEAPKSIAELSSILETINLNAEIEIEEETEELSLAQIKNLRKHPIYSVEEFLNIEIEEEKQPNDFFSWLNKPKNNISTITEIEEEEIPKEIEKESIIDKFIAINPQISRPKKEFYSAENMAKKSEEFDWDFVTETLANIYYEQGNKEMAIKAYEKLSLQNPMKKAYFASLIQKIKKEK